MAVEVPQTQRLLDVAEVLEEHHPFGQVREPPVLLRSQPGGDEVLYLPRLIQEGDDAVARPGRAIPASLTTRSCGETWARTRMGTS